MVYVLDYPTMDLSPSPTQANVHIWPKLLPVDEEGLGHGATMGRSALVKPPLVAPEEVVIEAAVETPAMVFAPGMSVTVKDVADRLHSVGSTPYYGNIHLQAGGGPQGGGHRIKVTLPVVVDPAQYGPKEGFTAYLYSVVTPCFLRTTGLYLDRLHLCIASYVVLSLQTHIYDGSLMVDRVQTWKQKAKVPHGYCHFSYFPHIHLGPMPYALCPICIPCCTYASPLSPAP